MDLKKKSVSVTSGKQWQAFKLALCLQCFICKKDFGDQQQSDAK